MTNVSILEGRLLYDPVLSITTNTKRPVCNFLMVCNARGPQGPKEYIECESWNTIAENICTYLKKGSRLTVTGYLHSKVYEDPLNKAKDIYKTVLSVTSVSFGEKDKDDNEKEQKEKEEEKK